MDTPTEWKKIIALSAYNGGRRSVLDRYYDDITVEQVESDQEGWNRIKNRPPCFGGDIGSLPV